MMKLHTVIGLFVTSALLHSAPPPTVVHYCSGCHGSGGNAELPYVPRLAGQRQAYLSARLDSFRHTAKPAADQILHLHRHADAYMVGIAHAVTLNELAVAARWYSVQAPVGGRGSSSAAGRELYSKGLPSSKVPPCASCHEAESAPILAGQNAEYVTEQLELFRRGIRTNEAMTRIARALTRGDAKAVAAYVQDLPEKR